MISKIIITALVLTIAWAVIRKRRQEQSREAGTVAALPETVAPSTNEQPETRRERQDWHFALYAFVGVIIVIGAGLYYRQWQRDHQVLTVRLIRDDETPAVSYQVYRYALEDRRFITVDGVSVIVADDERMEVLGL